MKNTFIRKIRQHLLSAFFWMVLPALVFFFTFTTYPVIEQFFLAFTERGKFTLDKVIQVLSDNLYFMSYVRTVGFIVLDISIKFGLGLFAALGLKGAFRGRSFVRNVTLLPWLIPVVPSLFLWMFLYDPEYGLLNYFLKSLGLVKEPVSFLFDINTAFICLVWAHAWKYTPLWTLVLLAGLYSIPEEYYEAAKIDGASPLATFFNITLPLIKNYLLMNVILSLIWTIGEFATPWIMTRGGPADSTHIISTYAYWYYTYGNVGISSASLVLGIPLVLLLLFMFVRVLSRRVKT